MKELKTRYKNDLNNAIDSTVHFDKLFNKTVLITGITGLIGGFIVDILLYANETLEANIEIYGLARNEQRARERFACTNSKKFHYSWCSSVSDIKEKNKVPFSSVQAAEEAGYEPCKKCNPDN